MPVITIPRKITKGAELVVIPRREYEEFLRLRKVVPAAKLTPTERRDLEKAREEYKRGEYITLEEFERGLGITHSKTR